VEAVTRSAERAEALLTEGLTPIVADVMRPDTLSALPSADVLLYAVGFDRAAGHARREVYVQGLENVLRTASNRTGRCVYVSSTSVYGQTAGEWVDELSPCEPVTEGGRVCLEAEQLLRRRGGEGHAADAIVLRLSGIYGPGRLLARWEALRAGDAVTGDPEAWLNLIHVEDAALIAAACAKGGRTGATYLVTDDRPITRREYHTRLAELAGAPSPRFTGVDADHARISGLNKRCRNARVKRELELELRFPTIAEGLPAAVRG
jgi:nucleoside-diphosphate-sugar epimerase